MAEKIIEKIEDIYPLTIVRMRYGGKYVITSCESDSEWIHDVQLDDEPSYNLELWMERNNHFVPYGYGETLTEAFENFKTRQQNKQ